MRITLVFTLVILSVFAINCKRFSKDDDTNAEQAEDIIKELNQEIEDSIKNENLNSKKYHHNDQINFDRDDKNSDIKQKYDDNNPPKQPQIPVKSTTPPTPASSTPSTFDHQGYEHSNSWTVFFILCILGNN